MKTVRITYRATGIYATQKTVTVTVSNNRNAFNEFEEKVKDKFGDVDISHVAKEVRFN